MIRGIGPRYCPSIEDKVVKFAHNPTHQMFIEPEGWDEPTLYVGGFSTSLPAEVQLEMLRTLPDSNRARWCAPDTPSSTTWCRRPRCAKRSRRAASPGSTTAASSTEPRDTRKRRRKGLIAGINAARAARGDEPLRLARSDAYIGVLVDDLVTKGVDEPYRMLTSRAEHRVVLRHDNADRAVDAASDARSAWSTTRRGRHSSSDARRLRERHRAAPSRRASAPERSASERFEPAARSPMHCAGRGSVSPT